MKHNAHSRRNIKTNRNMWFSGSKPAAENVIVFSPTACPSSEKKQCAPEALCGSKSDAPAAKKDAAGSGFFSLPFKKLADLDMDRFLDSLLSEDFILIALIALLIMERIQLKKNGADKSKLNDYDLMILALLYIFL